ncbi:hypothetical protein [Ktedonospora formicarum]|uniref:DUF885 domain-containing protein n=1 Tax=Ktedonospora formicarum TaxID=2778364 RepID=A0A8J3MYF5_9CHLR|nr:hypothetical protein [Ktedonospora formicarum]GHO49595.1 hypothetical protein KSX_77580 [Ktedonospora formicarum]
MSNNWLRDYTVLALRLQKTIDEHTNYESLEEYQPPEWYEQVRHEPVQPADVLAQHAQELSASLSQQGFEAHRERYLAKQVRALETVALRLRGERFTLQEELERCFDLQIEWLPESSFEEAYTLYDEALPGSGDIAERLRRWRASVTLPPEKAHLLPSFLQRALDEARRRTRALISLPADEQTGIQVIHDQPVRAVACYLGEHRGRVHLNPQVPFPLSDLFYVLCHEGYPGHLAEAMLKDDALIQERGYLEQRVCFLYTPQLVLSEGIALLAHEMLFAPGEAQQWLAEHIYPEAGIDPDTSDLTKIHRANDLLYGVSCNAAWLLREGRSPAEALDYLMRYRPMSEEAARRELASMQRPFHDTYIFTYFHGRRLLEPYLQGPQRQERLRQVLTQQVLPSDLSMREL